MAAVEERGRRARAALIALVALSACGRETINLPSAENAKSVVLLVEGSGTVEAHDLGQPNRRVSVDGAELLTAIFYEKELADYDLSEGTVAPYAAPDGRRLPPSSIVFRHDGEWRASTLEASPLYASFRLAPESAETCASSGGCYPEGTSCTTPCPEVMALVPPLVPPSRLPVLRPCPDGWGEVRLSDLTTCEPRSPVPCSSRTHPFLGGRCRAIGEACRADGWPSPDPARTVFWVRAGANGIGTQADPFATIGEALAAAPDRSIIALASGRYEETFTLEGERELLGACAAEVFVSGAITTSNASLRALTIEGTLANEGGLVLEDVLLSATLDNASALLIEGSVATGLISGSGGTIVRDSVLEALHTTSATISGTFVRSELRATGGTVSVAESELVTLSAGGGAIVHGSRSIVRGAPEVIRSSGAQVFLSRCHIQGRYLNEAGAQARIEHSRLGGLSSSGGLIVLERTLLERSGSDVGFTNLTITESTLRAPLVIGDGTELHVDTSRFEGIEGFAIIARGVVDRPGDTYQLFDLEFEGVGAGIRAERSQVGRLARIVATGLRGPLFESASSAPVVFAEDLHASDLDCGGCAAITVREGSLDLDRFRLEDLDGPAILLEESTTVRLANGTIARAPIGIRTSARRDLRVLLETVRFEEVERVFDLKDR